MQRCLPVQLAERLSSSLLTFLPLLPVLANSLMAASPAVLELFHQHGRERNVDCESDSRGAGRLLAEPCCDDVVPVDQVDQRDPTLEQLLRLRHRHLKLLMTGRHAVVQKGHVDEDGGQREGVAILIHFEDQVDVIAIDKEIMVQRFEDGDDGKAGGTVQQEQAVKGGGYP
eukprot:601437-Hanusia_phi.AAC.1